MSSFAPAITSKLFSKAKGLLGGGGAGGVGEPKKQKELGLLSLSELTSLRGEEESTIEKQLSANRANLAIFEKNQNEKGIETATARIAELQSGLQSGQGTGRLGEINTRIQELTRQRLGTRTRRATAISTLLGRGR